MPRASAIQSAAGSRNRVLAGVLLLAACLLTGVSGCGFHLRGSAALPAEMDVIYVTGRPPWNSLVEDLTEALLSHDVRVTRERDEATAVLRIISNESSQQLLSVNTAGKVLEYELRQTMVFSMTKADGHPLIKPQRVTTSSAYLYNSNDILGKEREKKVVFQTLQKNLVNLAILRIAAAR
jgi:LPS-assembly lipoprotein